MSDRFVSMLLLDVEIYVMNADGSDQVNVSHRPQSDFLPSWQPQAS